MIIAAECRPHMWIVEILGKNGLTVPPSSCGNVDMAPVAASPVSGHLGDTPGGPLAYPEGQGVRGVYTTPTEPSIF